MKKGLLVLIAAVSFLFYSCGSTKQQTETTENLEPEVQIEEAVEETSETVSEQTEDAEENTVSEEQEASEENEEPSSSEDLNLLYPPLEEIEEPDLIDVSPEEIEAQAQAATKEAEQQENQITEPVVEEEELPPLPVAETEDSTGTDEALRQAQGPQDGTQGPQDSAAVPELVEGLEAQEEASIEPTIEVQIEEEAEPEPEILPSRSVSLKKGETLVITYPGSGWIYMGSTSEYNNLASRGRKLGTTDTKYTLLAKEAGTQIHHFYKVDNLTGEYIDDYIEVTVLEKKGNSSTVVNAPEYSQVVPKKPETPAKATPKATPVQTNETTEQTSEQTASQALVTPTDTTTKTSATSTKSTTDTSKTSTSTTKTQSKTQTQEDVIEVETEDTVIVIDEEETEEVINLEPFLEKARTSVSSKKYDDAYTALTQYLEFSTDNRDEALYLLGQVFESDSKYKDIKQAVETYQTLCDSYPASKYWDAANKRIVYLKRFYINIH